MSHNTTLKVTLLSLLDEINKQHPNVAKASIDILNRIISGIIQDPDNQQKRQFKCRGQTFSKNILGVSGALQFLFAIGFEKKVMDHEEWVVFSGKTTDPLRVGSEMLVQAVSRAATREANAKRAEMAKEQEEIDFRDGLLAQVRADRLARLEQQQHK